MASETMTRALHRLRAGFITFNQFARETHDDWTRMAAKMLRKWRCPPNAQSIDDVRQDLLLSCWMFATGRSEIVGYDEDGRVVFGDRDWDPARGRLDEYVAWNATDKAKKKVHKARGAKLHDPDHEDSRVPRPFSSYGEEPDDAQAVVERLLLDAGFFAAPEQERRLLEQERVEEVTEAASGVFPLLDTDEERVALLAFAIGGTVDEGADLLYGSVEDRLACELGSESEARRLVGGAVRKAAARVRAA